MEQSRRGLDTLRQNLEGYTRVAFDTATLIYFVEGSERYESLTRPIFKDVETGKMSAVVSVVVELELLVKPLRSASFHAVQDIMELISGFPNLEIMPVTRRIAQRAAEIRAHSRVGVADAIIVATAVEAACDAVIGNDLYCARHINELPYIYLEDFARQSGV